MRNPFQKPFVFALVAASVITLSSVTVLLDTFVIQRVGDSGEIIVSLPSSETSSNESSSVSETSTSESSSGEILPTYTETSYVDEHMSLTISTVRRHSTTVYIADIQTDDPLFLRTALAHNTYGRNITQKTSSMATEHGAIFAINGDYYGARTDGFVVRNGTLYRSTKNSSASGQALIMNTEGAFEVLSESQTTRDELIAAHPVHAWSFGPALMIDGNITVDSTSEVNQSSSSNPRTAIGQIAIGHYVCIVSDGRLTNEAGLSLLELAEEFESLGCTYAYNLDGGGSSTMWFNGRIINQPVNSGSTISERSVSDCVYLGYA